jgi:hypothetical protein
MGPALIGTPGGGRRILRGPARRDMRSTPWRTPGRRDRDDLRVAVTAGDVRDAAAARRLDAETPRTDRPRPHPQVSRPQHPITDFENWTAAFARFADARWQAGVRPQRIRRPVDDPAFVVVDLDFDTVVAGVRFSSLASS